ncbi:DNA-directed RNA polymerase [Larsenimonas suaedae]|uniref:DNA-directed RNA polymerase n=1 Tax=Larsenimonas suaedae TaxID=1851019 RepID=A0ABU1GZ05_9GAMM|nr:DNA-directed RNA polymerase [Larsenimonas suaedae]MCM2973747.1 hypothetical protein [Larsenimonas suaedae]MDR5897271.1 hypothetical protein [Larsenimonas suaedae]
MEQFTGWQYLLIDAANNFGLDKEVFETRIQWATDNLDRLEALAEEADNVPRYTKSVLAIRRALRGEAIGHLVGFDACCSGLQIMSTLTGCEKGAAATGLINPTVRADAYTIVTDVMNSKLANQGLSVQVSRKSAKSAVMTVFYGSKAQPKAIFGEETEELKSFYLSVQEVAPGAYELLHELLDSWQPFALSHDWVLPDNYHAHVKVMEKVEKRLEVDELNHATFTYEYFENEGSESGLSNVANVVHSIDAYVLRSLIRRCNYDRAVVESVQDMILEEALVRDLGLARTSHEPDATFARYLERMNATNMVDPVILSHLTPTNLQYLSDSQFKRLTQLVSGMLAYQPFEIVSVHDEFQCHPNNMNHLRQQYINIFAELADSEILSDILSQIHGVQGGSYTKISSGLSQSIRQSNYAIC